MNPIKSDPEIMHSTPCFAGTRVPVMALAVHELAKWNLTKPLPAA